MGYVRWSILVLELMVQRAHIFCKFLDLIIVKSPMKGCGYNCFVQLNGSNQKFTCVMGFRYDGVRYIGKITNQSRSFFLVVTFLSLDQVTRFQSVTTVSELLFRPIIRYEVVWLHSLVLVESEEWGSVMGLRIYRWIWLLTSTTGPNLLVMWQLQHSYCQTRWLGFSPRCQRGARVWGMNLMEWLAQFLYHFI